MSILELGALGEFVGAFAVVLTLIYLAIQVRQNTSSTRASTYSDTTDGWHKYMQSLSTADINILISLATKPTEMTTAEFYRGYYLCRVLFRRMENDYFQFNAGTFEAATWEAYVRGFREDTFNNPALRVMWKLQSDYLDPAFRKYMQLQIDEASRVAQQNVRAQFEQLIAGEHRQNDVAPDAA